MTAFIAQGIGLAVSLSIKAAAVFGCGALLVLALRRSSAALRHRAGTWAIWGAALLPIAALLLPALELPVLPARAARLGPFVPIAASAAASSDSPARSPVRVVKLFAPPGREQLGREATMSLPGAEVLPTTTPSFEHAVRGPASLTLVARLRHSLRELLSASTIACLAGLAAGAVWFAGLLLLWSRLAIGLRRVHRLSREAQPADPSFDALAVETARRLELGGTRTVRILIHPDVPVPMTTGLRRPIVLLPAGANEWPDARRRVVLLHELAHVRRGDWAQLVSSELALGLWWFHPLAWWLARSVRQDAEQAADDLVLSAGTRPSDYAAQLLEMVRSLRPDAAVPRPAMAMAQAVGIEERVRSILDGTRRRGLGVVQGRALAMALGAAVLALAIARPTFARVAESSAELPALAPLPPEPPGAQRLFHRAFPPRALGLPQAPKAPLPPLPPAAPLPPLPPAAPVAPLVPAAPLPPLALAAPLPPLALAAPLPPLAPAAPLAPLSPAAPVAPRPPRAERDVERAIALAEEESGIKLQHLTEMISGKVERELQRVGTRLADLGTRHHESVDSDDDGDSDEVDSDLYDRAMRLHERGRYKQAIELFKKAVDQDQRADAASYNIACGYAQLEDVEHAIEWLKRATDEGEDAAQMAAGDDDFDSVRDNPKFRAALRELRAQRGSQHPQEARAAERRYQRLVQRAPKGSEPWASLGRELLDVGSYDLAAQAYQASAERSSSPGTSLYNGACALSLKGDKKGALERLQAAIEQGFDDPHQIRKDDDLDTIRDEPRFAELVQLAKDLELNLESSNGNFFVNLGPIHIGRTGHGKRHAQEAADDVAHYQEMAKKHANVGRAHYNLGYAQLAADDNSGAERSFGEALSLGYRKGATLYNLACAQARQKKADAALDSLKKAQEAGFEIGSYLRNDDDLDNLRDDARFKELRQKARAAERKHDDDEEDDE